MKILCTADWHIGKKNEGFSRLEEQKIVLDQIVSITQQEQVDIVIVAGDCFDTQSPSPEMTKLFVSTMAQLSRECLVLVIAGNHDNPLFLSSSEAFASQLGVMILGYPLDTPFLEENSSSWQVLQKDKGMLEIFFKKSKKTVRFLLSPYANARRLKKDLGTQDADQKAWDLLCEEWERQINPEIINILVTHHFFLPEPRDLYQEVDSKEDSEERSIVGTIGAIPLSSLPDHIDYVIAGHLHRPHSLYSSRTKAFYTGSPLIYGASESGQQKSVLILELGKKNKEYIIPLEGLKDIKQIYFDDFTTIPEILHQEREHYLILIWQGINYLTAEQNQYLRAHHNLLLRIESKPKIASSYDIRSIEHLQEQSIEELFIEYFRSKYQNQEPPEDLLDLFRECLSEESEAKILQKKRGFLPKSLKIKGFYSYKEETSIDFGALEQKGFFGIFGNTGSGKSALIEAVIIALFFRNERFHGFGVKGKGNFSNSYGIMNLESQELLIEFTFEIFGSGGLEEYCCRIYGKRDKRDPLGVKITREVFINDQGAWISVELNSGEDLLGITYDDFRKTIVLQQQDFLGFISAEPKDSTATLMRLFQLERFELSGAVEKIEKSELQEFYNIERKLQELQSANEESLQELQQNEQNLQNDVNLLKEQMEVQQEKLNQLKQCQAQQEQAQQIQKRFDLLQAQYEEYRQAQERLQILPMIEREENKIQAQYRKDNLQASLEHLTQDLKNREELLQNLINQGKELVQELQELENNLSRKRKQSDEQSTTKLTEQMLVLEIRQQQYLTAQRESTTLNQKIESIQINLREKDQIIVQLSTLQKREELAKDIGGIVLKHLHEGSPCPLCGSLEHPNPYIESDNNELLTLSNQVYQLQQKISHIGTEEILLRDYQEKYSEYQDRMKVQLGEYTCAEDLKQAYQKICRDKIEQDQELVNLKKDIDLLQQKETVTKHKKQELTEQYQQVLREKDRLEWDKDSQYKELCELELILAQGQEEYDREYYNIVKTYPQKTPQDVEGFFRDFLVCSGEMKSIKNFTYLDEQGDLIPQIQESQDKLNQLSEQYSYGQQQLGSYRNEIITLQGQLNQKNKLQNTYQKLSLRKENIESLKKLFKASAFVYFIGLKYLSKLCYTANQRFLHFTQNQFELSAPEELDGKKGRIIIIDRLSGGSKRDLATLSGGQSFQAALSLALALADESGAGHRFFFVDEGFGTLDQDNLMIILDSLRKLVEIEQRVVGVISHIPLMKDEVFAYLHVSLDKKNGTTVTFYD
ncbi:MAG: exonuclease subunit SbcD [Brevinema sp.]